MKSSYLEKLIKDFFKRVEVKDIEITSEANLERKLACYIEDNIPKDFKLETQKSLDDFGIKRFPNLGKKYRMDIAIFNEDKSIKYAIELKYPKNVVEQTGNKGGYNRYIDEFIKDIYFTECLKNKGFTETYVLIIVDNPKYYDNKKFKARGIYKFFRDGKRYPITKNDEKVNYDISGEYHVIWKDFSNKKYYFKKIKF